MTAIAMGTDSDRPQPPFLGLAPFLRLSLAGVDFGPACDEMLAEARGGSRDANLWMNLSIALLSLGLRTEGLAVQAQALRMQRVYHIFAAQQPAILRLLVLVAPGDLAANSPIDCLLERGDIDLIFYYCSEHAPLASPIPEHDVLMVGVSESDENQSTLALLETALDNWPRPIINRPQNIVKVERNAAATLLSEIPGLLMPHTLRVGRAELSAIANGDASLDELFDGCDFSVILRPVGSHGGHGLDKIDCLNELKLYLEKIDAEYFYISRFIDYSGSDGLFRKYRIALIDGKAFACHMAISSNWMIHYVNAGMYENAQKRLEEAEFMANFDDFVARHRSALTAIFQRTNLEYFCMDCAETRDGQLLIFEIDHAMIVHAMDSEELFPHKQFHMQKVQRALREYCLRLIAADSSGQLASIFHAN